jgi:hypothetical protein
MQKTPKRRPEQPLRPLSQDEGRHYRDRFRAARYAALADAEGFSEICFALEAIGLRLLGEKGALEQYKARIGSLARLSPALNGLVDDFPYLFKTFDALYRTVQMARNDAMHTGAYARHATQAAIELCIGLEEALMADVERTVGAMMVRSPITIERWQPLAHARQVMLTHSFSFLPVRFDDGWHLISELGLAQFLNVSGECKRVRLGQSIEDARTAGMALVRHADDKLLRASMSIKNVLDDSSVPDGPTLWLVVDETRPDHLAGVLSPFELM